MKKLCLLFGLCFMLTACSASSDSSSSSSSSSSSVTTTTATESAMDIVTSTGGGVETAEKQTQESKFIYTVNLTAETTQFGEDITTLKDLVSSVDGYFEYASQQELGLYRYGSYTIRIPADDLDTFTSQAGSLFLVTNSTSQIEDISYEYYDTQGRLETQQLKLERLQALLAQAETMEDLITLESAISQTQEAVDAYSGNMVYYDAQVEYATVQLSLYEVSTLSNVEQTPMGFSGQLSNAFGNGIDSFINSLENLALFFAYHWLSLLVWAGIITVVVRIVRGKRPQKPTFPKWKKTDKEPPQE